MGVLKNWKEFEKLDGFGEHGGPFRRVRECYETSASTGSLMSEREALLLSRGEMYVEAYMSKKEWRPVWPFA